MAKQHKYSSSRGNDGVGQLSEKLSDDLRNHIRTLVTMKFVCCKFLFNAGCLLISGSFSDVVKPVV